MIHEVIVTTRNMNNKVHIAPMGIKLLNENSEKFAQISPFKPSQTLDNILETDIATINFIDDVKVFAGIVTGKKKDWKLASSQDKHVPHLEHTNTHMNAIVDKVFDDSVRPKIKCKIINEEVHRSFLGFNRAQFSVIELAVLSTRLGMIDDNKVKEELKYLKIGIDKTAGDNEKEAWGWIENKIKKYFDDND
tara:strand:+ start:1174 stop:1749 length:576 start_codon:yes stop_codon:yes gene_type:complete